MTVHWQRSVTDLPFATAFASSPDASVRFDYRQTLTQCQPGCVFPHDQSGTSWMLVGFLQRRGDPARASS